MSKIAKKKKKKKKKKKNDSETNYKEDEIDFLGYVD
jgi:hypothetical protein